MTKPRVVVKKFGGRWTVWVVNGCQSFQFKYTSTRADCVWYKRMLKIAGVGK